MDDKAITAIIGILTAIVGVSVIAVLVSNQANTANVLKAGGSAFSGILQAAVSPVTGGGGLGSNLSSGLLGSLPGGIG